MFEIKLAGERETGNPGQFEIGANMKVHTISFVLKRHVESRVNQDKVNTYLVWAAPKSRVL